MTPTGYVWLSAPEVAKKFNCTTRAIRIRCQRGRFAALGIPFYRDVRNRLWIYLRDED